MFHGISFSANISNYTQSYVALQTKNISGRFLVGLRWWNEVTADGSNWRFESLGEVYFYFELALTLLHSQTLVRSRY